MSGTLMISVGSRRLRSWCDVALLLQGLRSPVLGIMGVTKSSIACCEGAAIKQTLCFVSQVWSVAECANQGHRLNQPCSYFGTFTLVSSEGVCEGALAMNPRLRNLAPKRWIPDIQRHGALVYLSVFSLGERIRNGSHVVSRTSSQY